MNMWWTAPIRNGFAPLLPNNVLDVLTRAYAVIEVGGISGTGIRRGRNFEDVFYAICAMRGLHLCEKAGARSLAEQRSASGFMHEVDAGSRSSQCLTHWELKYLSAALEKNELLIFNGKALDFLQGSTSAIARTPLLRFLLSGNPVRDECRYFAVLWGIMLIEPQRFPLPLLYEAVARDAGAVLTQIDCGIVKTRVAWSCRPLQLALQQLVNACNGENCFATNGAAIRASRSVVDAQEQIGADVQNFLNDQYPDWLDEIAEDTWRRVGGW